MARPTGIARRYAEAAFQLAERDGTLDAWAEQLDVAATLARDATVAQIADDPSLASAGRRRAVAAMLGDRVSPGVRNLALLLVDRGRFSVLPAVAAEYRRLLDASRGIVPATVTTARPLDQAETDAVRRRVEELTGQQVQLTVGVDPDLIGGLTVRVGDRLIDGSVRGRLERLRERLVAGAR